MGNGERTQQPSVADDAKLLVSDERSIEGVMINEFLTDLPVQQEAAGFLHKQVFLTKLANEFNKLAFVQPNERGAGRTERCVELPD